MERLTLKGRGREQNVIVIMYEPSQRVLLVMAYGSEKWSLTVDLIIKFKVALRDIERAFLNVSLSNNSLSKIQK